MTGMGHLRSSEMSTFIAVINKIVVRLLPVCNYINNLVVVVFCNISSPTPLIIFIALVSWQIDCDITQHTVMCDHEGWDALSRDLANLHL